MRLKNKIGQSYIFQTFLWVVRQYLFWLLFFQFHRLIFLIYNFEEIVDSSFFEVLKAFYKGIYLDNSTTRYILILPLLLSFIMFLIKIPFLRYVIKVYNWLIIFLANIIAISELPLYDEWKVKLNYKALSFLARPAEIFHTASLTSVILGVFSIIIFTILFIVIYNRYVHIKVNIKQSWSSSAINLLLIPIVFIWGIRGGTQPIPIHQADVYFSKNNFINLLAVNSAWNLGSNIEKNIKFFRINPFVFFVKNEAIKIVDSLYAVEKDTSLRVVNIDNKTNVAIILLESWSADCIKTLGGFDSITPNFNYLAEEGILCTNAYAPGSLSDQGIASVISAQPALPEVIIVNQPDKFVKLPALSSDFKKMGYTTSFLFGGQLSYGNIKAYVISKNFDYVLDENKFSSKLPRGRLGIHDEYMFEQFLNHLDTLKQPFFSMTFTLSSHSPFDMPYAQKFKWGGDAQKYINGVAYTDSVLGVFFNKAKNKAFYKNTLFILVADHSHNSPKGWHPHAKEYRKIPLLFYGDVIKSEWKSKRIDKIISQCDIAASILHQFNKQSKHYKWSKDIFNPYTRQFAYYAFDDGMGWLDDNNYFVYLYKTSSLLFYNFKNKEDSIKTLNRGKAYI